MQMLLKWVVLGVLVAGLGGCAIFSGEIDKTRDWTAKRLYNEGKEALDGGDYETAIDYFEKLGARYPFGRYSQQAELEIAYAYFKDGESESAVAACDRFIRLHPRHPYVDYAYYLKGLANYSRDSTLLERYLPGDPTQRDPGASLQAFRDFSILVKKFPDSKYASDAIKRMTYLRNNLARHEVNVAEYYMRRGAYVAALNRGKYVVEHYSRAPAVADALVVMAKAYKVLGMTDLASDTLRVLELNHPAHPGIASVRNLPLLK